MGRRGRKAELFQSMREPVAAREELERRWRSRIFLEDLPARLVTADDARIEPFHRWLPFRQGFSPGLVRLFLKEAVAPGLRIREKPVFDPFSGSGTTVVECGRLGVAAVGLEACPSLAFLTNAKFESPFPPWTSTPEASDWREVAAGLVHPLHQSALMLAVARRTGAAGQVIPAAPPLARVLENVVSMMRDDLRRPLAVQNPVSLGDAREPSPMADESVRAILTSPPYLSRYDYGEITAPIDEVHRFWYAAATAGNVTEGNPTDRQLPASTGRSSISEHGRASPVRAANGEMLDAVVEIQGVLLSVGEKKLAPILQNYFEDLRRVLRECHRVMASGATAWFVMGGARPKGVHVPSDLILAETAEQEGFVVELVRVARELIHARRKFGSLGHISPRESVVVLRKP